CRRQILQQSFAGQLEAVVRAFHAVAEGNLDTRDFTRAAVRRVLIEILVHFPVYRIYATVQRASASDRLFLARALAQAKTTCLPADLKLLAVLGNWLLGDGADCMDHQRLSTAVTRIQQLSAPLSAKSVEDTALYRFGRLLSRNDVGFDPRHFGCSVADFHRVS